MSTAVEADWKAFSFSFIRRLVWAWHLSLFQGTLYPQTNAVCWVLSREALSINFKSLVLPDWESNSSLPLVRWTLYPLGHLVGSKAISSSSNSSDGCRGQFGCQTLYLFHTNVLQFLFNNSRSAHVCWMTFVQHTHETYMYVIKAIIHEVCWKVHISLFTEQLYPHNFKII